MRAHERLGGVTVEQYGVAPDTIDLAKADVREKIVGRAVDVVKRGGFDGVHYDIEIVPDGHAGYPALLDLTRARLPDRQLSVAVLCGWSPEYMRSFAGSCDSIDLMACDLSSRDASAYVEQMAVLTERLCDALRGTRCRFTMGIPSYEEKNAQHDPSVENVQTALLGVRTGLGRVRANDAFKGVAVYSQWTTDDREWKDLEDGWPLR